MSRFSFLVVCYCYCLLEPLKLKSYSTICVHHRTEWNHYPDSKMSLIQDANARPLKELLVSFESEVKPTEEEDVYVECMNEIKEFVLRLCPKGLYKKKKDFASDLSIDPIVLSQVLNDHRDPQESFIHRLVLHSMASFEKVCEFNEDMWPRIFYQDKVCKFLSSQNTLKEAESKYVTARDFSSEE